MPEKVSIVVTSIFNPNASLRELARGATENNWNFIIVGDSKSPRDFFLEGAEYFDVEAQLKFGFSLSPLCPTGHYTRKNLGYLQAIKNGSSIIIETDDDNLPVAGFWEQRSRTMKSIQLAGEGWCNIYDLYSEKKIWPRGLPLESILTNSDFRISNEPTEQFTPIQQGLADGNPDVDAVFRMTQELPHTFEKLDWPLRLSRGLWCPFNSQNTTWFRESFPLLYLPSYCTFRMTDIWRSFVTARIAWECNWELLFHNATVFQERNEHNLLRDFEQEIPGYLLNNRIKKILEDTNLRSGVENIAGNMILCYEALVREQIITDRRELDLLKAWLYDIEKLT